MARSDGDGDGDTDGTGAREPALVRSVDRAVTALEVVAARGEVGITELAEELGVHKSTASRLVAALTRRGMLEQQGDRGRISLGFGVVRLAALATGRMDLARLGQPTCQQLAEEVGETVNLAALSAAGPSYRLPRRRARAIVPDLRTAAEDLSTRLGWISATE